MRSKISKWKIHLLGLALAAGLMLLLLPVVALSQTSANYGLTWSAIAGGGGASTSASYQVSGTVGQSIAHTQPLASNSYRLQGGFWPAYADSPTAEHTPTPTPSEVLRYLPLIRR